MNKLQLGAALAAGGPSDDGPSDDVDASSLGHHNSGSSQARKPTIEH
jgi:hypothetical protein